MHYACFLPFFMLRERKGGGRKKKNILLGGRERGGDPPCPKSCASYSNNGIKGEKKREEKILGGVW